MSGTYSDEDLGHLPPAPPSSASDPPRQEEGSPVRLDECGELTVGKLKEIFVK